MRRIVLFFIALAWLVSSAMAQGLHFNFGGGLSSHYGSAKAVGAFKVGVGYEVEFDQHWSFTPSLEVYGKGWKDPNETVFVFDENGEQVFDEETGEPVTGIMSRSATKNYLQIPLLVSYYIRTGASRYVVLAAGPYAAYGVAGKQKTKGDTERPGAEKFYYEKKTFDEPRTHRCDIGLRAKAGYQFASGITLGLEADLGLLKFNGAGNRNVSGLVTIGYKLHK